MLTLFVDTIFQAQSQFPNDFFHFEIHDTWGSQNPDYRINLRKHLHQYLQKLDPTQDYSSVLELSTYPKEFKQLFVSISHCKDLGVFVVSSRPVGVDIEITSRLKKEVVQRVSTPAEMLLSDEPQLLWPAKEALFKCENRFQLMSEIKLDTWKKSQNRTYEFLSSNLIGWVQTFRSHTVALAVKNS